MREPLTTYYTTIDIARRWDRSPDRIRQIARAGRLRPAIITQSGQRLFDQQEVERYERETRNDD